MRLPLVALAAALVLPAAALSADAQPPQRKAGWWEIVSILHMGAPMVQAMHLCTDAATEAKTNVFLNRQGGPPGATCADTQERTADGWKFVSVCTRPDGKSLRTDGVASGDFATAYKVDATNVMTPPPNAAFAQTRMVVEARWQGACPDGRAPGDMVLQNGMLVNLNTPEAPPRRP